MMRIVHIVDNDASYTQVPGAGASHTVLLSYQNCKGKNYPVVPKALELRRSYSYINYKIENKKFTRIDKFECYNYGESGDKSKMKLNINERSPYLSMFTGGGLYYEYHMRYLTSITHVNIYLLAKLLGLGDK